VRPFVAQSQAALIMAVMHGEPAPPSSRNREIPPGLDEVVQKALSRRPEDRFATAEEMSMALETCIRENGGTLGSGLGEIVLLMRHLFGEQEALTNPGVSTTGAKSPISVTPSTLTAGAPITVSLATKPTKPPNKVEGAPKRRGPNALLLSGLAILGLVATTFAAVHAVHPLRRGVLASAEGRGAMRPEPGRLILRVAPFAEVFLDGRSVGVTPLAGPLELAPGPRTLVLKNEGLGAERKVVIDLKPGEETTLHVNLLEPP
jgi:serine/threonine-protein kinase